MWKDNRPREPLPIDAHLPALFELVKNNSVVICTAEMGSGKTTRIGQFAVVSDPNIRVVMTQPRRNSCRWNGQRIASELGCEPGELVGWTLIDEPPLISNQTRLELLIDNTLVNRFCSPSYELPYDLIIIDEVHERSIAIDLLLGFVKEKVRAKTNTRAIIMSGTIDTAKIATFFDNAPVIYLPGNCYPVDTQVIYLKQGEHHTSKAAITACKIVDNFLQNGTITAESSLQVTNGNVLILLPGKEDIKEVKAELIKKADQTKRAHHIQILECHRAISSAQQDKVLSIVPDGILRFICATSILRTSITIPDTIAVIDTLQIKREFITTHGVRELIKASISQAEAKQSKRRAGRTRPGIYMPISYQNQYFELDPWAPPEISRGLLSNAILRLSILKKSMLTFPFLDSPIPMRVDLETRKLKTLQALDNNGEITKLGRLSLYLHLEPEIIAALTHGKTMNILPETFIAITILTKVDSIFQTHQDKIIIDERSLMELFLIRTEYNLNQLPSWIIKKDKSWEIDTSDKGYPYKKNYIAIFFRTLFSGKSHSDLVGLVNTYRTFKAAQKSKNKQELELWCSNYGLNYKQLIIADESMSLVRGKLSTDLNIGDDYIQVREFDGSSLTKAIFCGLLNNIGKREEYDMFSSLYGSFRLSDQSVCPQKSTYILLGSLRKVDYISRYKKHNRLCDIAAPIELSWIQEITPNLCQRQQLEDYRFSPEEDQVTRTEILSYQSPKFVLEAYQIHTNSPASSYTIAAWLATQFFAITRRKTTYSWLPEIRDMFVAHLKKVRKLNIRAGRSVFPAVSLELLTLHFRRALAGIYHLKDLLEPHILLLPDLDRALIESTLQLNPKKFTILGISHKINYQTDSFGRYASPQTLLSNILSTEHQWLKLKPHDLTLPSGQRIDAQLMLSSSATFFLRWDSANNLTLSKLNLAGIDLSGADLSEVDLSEIIFDNKTVFPEYSSINYSHVAHFLSEDELCYHLEETLDRLYQATLSHPQKYYVISCIAKQITQHGSAESIKILSLHKILREAFTIVFSHSTQAPSDLSSIQNEVKQAIQSLQDTVLATSIQSSNISFKK